MPIGVYHSLCVSGSNANMDMYDNVEPSLHTYKVTYKGNTGWCSFKREHHHGIVKTITCGGLTLLYIDR